MAGNCQRGTYAVAFCAAELVGPSGEVIATDLLDYAPSGKLLLDMMNSLYALIGAV
jgi:hypothetical protein